MQMPSKNAQENMDKASQNANSLEQASMTEAQNLVIPESAPVILLEQLIFYLFSGGLLLITRGPHGTLAVMPSSVLLANLLSYLISLVVFILFILLRHHKTSVLQYLGIAQEVSFVFMFMYNVQFLIFTLLLRIFHSERAQDESEIDNDWFIILFNASKSHIYGYAVSTFHMVVTLVFSLCFFILFLTSHSFLRRIHHSESVAWTFLLSLLFIQSQFFLYHMEQMHHSTETCDMFMCDDEHNFWAITAILLIWLIDFGGNVLKQKVLVQDHTERKKFFIAYMKYFLVYVILLPAAGLIAVHFLSWLQHAYFYTTNVVFLGMFLASRLLDARQVFMSKQTRAKTQNMSRDTLVADSPKKQTNTTLFGTPQPRYFFKRQGRNNKRD